MRKMIKLAIGLAALGFVGLIGLSTMSIIWSVVAPHPRHHQVAVEPMTALAVDTRDVERAEPARVENVDIAYPMTDYAVAHTVKVNSIFQVLLFTAIALVLASAFVLLLRLTRAKHVSATSDDTALIHELARRAQDLSQRMEALETILLDRTRATR